MQEDYDRFRREQPPGLTEAERAQVLALSADLPALWRAEGTTPADRKEVVRCLVDRVVVHVRQDSEVVGITVHWKGGLRSEYQAIRPVKLYAQLEGYEQLMAHIAELRRQGYTSAGIARKLNEEGHRTPKMRGDFHPVLIRKLLSRLGLANEKTYEGQFGAHEWWLPDLAREIPLTAEKLSDWATPGLGHGKEDAGARAVGAVGGPQGVGPAAPAGGGLPKGHERIPEIADDAAQAEEPR